jgi:YYY domain-containing protein
LAFVAGLAAAIVAVRRGRVSWLLPVAWVVVDFALVGGRFTAFMRYLLPIYPALAVISGLGLVTLWRARRGLPLRFGTRQASLPRFSGPAVAASLLAGSVLMALAFVNGVYARPNTRILASIWMQQNIPAGATLSHTNWDDALPLLLPGDPPGRFQTVELSPFDTDSSAKEVAFADALDRIDYVVESSNRAYASIPRDPARYPSMTRYYEALWNGDLGFEKVADFEHSPELFGVRIPDRVAEEAFTVYDHPRVTIWKKTANYSRDRTLAILEPDRADAAVFSPPGNAATNQLILSPSEYATQQQGGTWASVFSASGTFSHFPWLWWLAWLELLSFASLPMATLVLRSLPDGGYGVSKVLGPAAATLLCWGLVAWGVTDFSRVAAVGSFVTILVGGAAIGVWRRKALLREMRERWRLWLACELVFLIAFAAFLALRAWNPAVWYHPTGGEKPMDLAYLTAVARSTSFPPYDPWFAGGYMNYYYMGWMVLAVPMRAFQTVPEVAFNLAVPTFAAMAAAVTFATGVNLMALRPDSRPAFRSQYVLVGVLGVVLFMVAGNFDALHQQVEHLQRVSDWGIGSHVPILGGAVRLSGGVVAWIGGAHLAPFDWWRSSRVHFGSSDITEFPFWSLLFADMHPQLMDLPFFGLAIALCLGYVAARLNDSARIQIAVAALLGVSIGFVRTVHTWDFPTALLLGLGAIALATWMAPGARRRRASIMALHIAALGAGVALPFLPFTSRMVVPTDGIGRSPLTTPIQQTFDHWGVFLIITVLFLVIRYREERFSGNALASVAGDSFGLCALFVLGSALYVAFDRQGAATVALLTFLVVLLGNLAILDLRARPRIVGRLVATAMLFVAFAIIAGTDLVRVNDDIERMNTVFKFSLQAWQLAALGCAFGSWYVLRALWSGDWRQLHLSRGQRRTSIAVSGILAAVAGAALLYPLLAVPERQDARFVDTAPTLNGLVFLENADPTFLEERGNPGPEDDYELHLNEDLPLIQWLRANVQGTPTIVEEVGPLYHWTGRFSEYTGLPAVIGWDWHQVQQRGEFASPVETRRKEVAAFYQSSNPIDAARFLRRYDVAYVMVSAWERALGDSAAIRMFESLPGLEPVFRSNENVIYRVRPDELIVGY